MRRCRLMPVVLGLVVGVVAAAGCDDSGSSGGLRTESATVPGGGATGAAAAEDPPVGIGARAQIQEVVDDLQDAITAGDGAGVCGELSDNAEKRMVAAGGGEASCHDVAAGTLEDFAGISRRRSEVTKLRVGRARAVTTVRDDGGDRYRVRFVKEHGAWVLPRVDLRSPAGLPRMKVPLPPDPAQQGGPRQRAAEVVADVQQALAFGPGLGACAELTSSAREAIERLDEDPPASCGDAVEAQVRRWRDGGVEPVISEIERVRLVDEGAIVTVRDPGREPYDVRVMGYDFGLWLLPELNLDDPSGLRPLADD